MAISYVVLKLSRIFERGAESAPSAGRGLTHSTYPVLRMFPVVGHFDRPLQSAPTMFQPFLRPCSILWRFYVGAENSKIPIPKIRYHPFGIGIGTDIAFGISVPESTAGSTEIPKYRISFGIPSSAKYWSVWVHQYINILPLVPATEEFV